MPANHALHAGLLDLRRCRNLLIGVLLMMQTRLAAPLQRASIARSISTAATSLTNQPICRHLRWQADAPEKACFVQVGAIAWQPTVCPRKPLARANSTTGTWQINEAYAYTLDRGLLAGMLPLFGVGSSILELGAGKGCYTVALLATGKFRSVHSFDGAPNISALTRGLVEQADLTAPRIALGGMSDWVVSTEVGEHLPPAATDTFLDTIARHARIGAVLSWGKPGQPGNGHVNGRTAVDIAARMAARRLCVDVGATAQLRSAAHGSHFKQTVQVYRRRDSLLRTCHQWSITRTPQAAAHPHVGGHAV